MYFLAYLIKNIHKVNIVGPMDKNVRPKRYGGPCTMLEVENQPSKFDPTQKF